MRNVILITLDATRKDVLGVYGNKKGLTPFIDSLSKRSLVFTRGQTTGPYTQASFPGILTSSYFLDYGQPKGLSPKRTLISEPLKKAGITTAAFHSNPYICSYFGWNRGWDIFYDSMNDQVEPRIPYVRGNLINTKVSNWLARYSKTTASKPFFLWLHYMDVHEPYLPEKKFIDMVDPSFNMSQDEMFNLFENILLKRDVSDITKIDILKRLYEFRVREVDYYIQEIFGTLERLNILNDTTVIITNDHGDEFGEHGGLSHDDKMYSELIDMPLIIYGTEKTGTCHSLVSNIDIIPTIVHLFGLDPVQQFAGTSLLPIENYPTKGCFGEALEQRIKKGGDLEKDIYFYRENDLKIIYRANTDQWELFDLSNDRMEKNNIIGTSSEAGRLKEILNTRVRRWIQK